MNSPETLVLASGNQKKLAELSSILNQFQCQLKPQSEFNIEDAVEDGLTFVENAIIKARHASQFTGLPAIADDSGIEVNFLRGRPGIYSARFAGENASDKENTALLLEQMKGVSSYQRKARYICVIVYLEHAEDPTPIIAQADWEGRLLETPIGDGGFGYDPIFYCPQLKMSAAQMTPQQKSSISHRGKALAKFSQAFSQRYGSASE